MEQNWSGKAVSIECDSKLGIFQGIIKDISASQITIVRAFRNGLPLRKQDAEVTLRSTDIRNIELINSTKVQSTVSTSVGGSCGGAVGTDNYATSTLSNKMQNMKISSGGAPNGIRGTPTSSRAPSAQLLASHVTATAANASVNGCSDKSSPPNSSTSSSVAQFFGNLIPPKVEVRMGAALGTSSESNTGGGGSGAISKPIDIVNCRTSGIGSSDNSSFYVQTNASNSIGNGKIRSGGGGGNGGGGASALDNSLSNGGNGNSRIAKKQRKQLMRENSLKQNQTFGTSVDDPSLNEDFDFEGNLALFDKRAIWNCIESKQQRPELLQSRPGPKKNKKYRHDENILVSEPTELRQIQTMFDSNDLGSSDFVTDEGLIIPTIPTFVRGKIELAAERNGLSLTRQIDILSRGATDLAILLLGGARRLTPNNCHQWPKITIICEKSDNSRTKNIGAATGRQLASHGLKVWLFLDEPKPTYDEVNAEVSLFNATDNTVVYKAVNALPTPDLVILSTNADVLSGDVKKWLSLNRASILAIDPPPSGIRDVSVKYSILPILPLNGISSNNCGKLYLCNLGIPDRFYRDGGIKYKSPFGHKFVIPIHSKD